MQQEQSYTNNSISVIGTIVSPYTFSHEIFGEGFYTFDIEVERLSESADVLPITISERIMDKEAFVIGALVHVTGQIRSYNNFIEAENRNRLVLTIFARDVDILTEYPNLNPNEVILDGYICKQPNYRTTPFGREISDILLAVNRSYNKSDYIPCIAWGRNSRFASKLKVGDSIRVYGRMQSRVYQKKTEDGETIEKVAYEVSVSKMEFDLTHPDKEHEE